MDASGNIASKFDLNTDFFSYYKRQENAHFSYVEVSKTQTAVLQRCDVECMYYKVLYSSSKAQIQSLILVNVSPPDSRGLINNSLSVNGVDKQTITTSVIPDL